MNGLKKRSNLLDFINLLWQNLDKPVKESFTIYDLRQAMQCIMMSKIMA